MKDLQGYINRASHFLTGWWENEDQGKPGLIISCKKENGFPVPDTDDLIKFWTDIDFIMDRQMSRIDNTNYHGLAVPYQIIDFASSAMACALGAKPEYVNKDTIWAHPVLQSLEEINELELSEDNPIYHHIMNLTRRAIQFAPNHHLLAHYPLEGALDIISDLYGTEKLLTDLLIDPDGVKKAAEHAKNLWLKGFREFNEMTPKTGNIGGIGWAGVWAPGTTFPIQEDFSYMISPDQFKEFCLPHVVDMVDAMEYPFYHLDGVGSLPHLDMLLGIDKLKAIQWQPGAGKDKLSQWYDVIKKIQDGGKSVQLYGKVEEIDDLVKNVGTKGLLVIVTNASNDDAKRLLDKYGYQVD